MSLSQRTVKSIWTSEPSFFHLHLLSPVNVHFTPNGRTPFASSHVSTRSRVARLVERPFFDIAPHAPRLLHHLRSTPSIKAQSSAPSSRRGEEWLAGVTRAQQLPPSGAQKRVASGHQRGHQEAPLAGKGCFTRSFRLSWFLVASLLLVAMPGAPSSVLARELRESHGHPLPFAHMSSHPPTLDASFSFRPGQCMFERMYIYI